MRAIFVDARKAAGQITVSVKVTNMWIVKLGMLFIYIGCRIGGFKLDNQ